MIKFNSTRGTSVLHIPIVHADELKGTTKAIVTPYWIENRAFVHT